MDWLTVLRELDEQTSVRARDLSDNLPVSFARMLGWDTTPDMPLSVSWVRRIALQWQLQQTRPTIVLSPRIGQEAYSLVTFWASHLGMTRSALTWACLLGAMPSATPAPNRIALLCLDRLKRMVPSRTIDVFAMALTRPKRVKKIPVLEGCHLSMRVTPDQRRFLEQQAAPRTVSEMVRKTLVLLSGFPLVPKISAEATSQLIDLQWQVFEHTQSGTPADLETVNATLREICVEVTS